MEWPLFMPYRPVCLVQMYGVAPVYALSPCMSGADVRSGPCLRPIALYVWCRCTEWPLFMPYCPVCLVQMYGVAAVYALLPCMSGADVWSGPCLHPIALYVWCRCTEWPLFTPYCPVCLVQMYGVASVYALLPCMSGADVSSGRCLCPIALYVWCRCIEWPLFTPYCPVCLVQMY